jgi:protein-tyrosine-phosphatase/DNA-binding transcriptional ArsR family regulator
MNLDTAAAILTTLGHSGRLAVYRLLVRHMPRGVRPSDIAAALGYKPNTLSVYVTALERAGLITSERHGKSVFYRANMPAMDGLLDFLIADCCRGRPDLRAPNSPQARQQEPIAIPERTYSVLFICTGNSARSIFAEALLADLGGGRFNAFSAGTSPNSEPNPVALEVLRRNGHDVSRLRCKTVEELQGPGAPKLDFVFTVCDLAANEECPPWPGQPITAHWGMPDPVKATGTDAERGLAFARTYADMRRRIESFAALPIAQLDRIALQARLDEIADIDVPTPVN